MTTTSRPPHTWPSHATSRPPNAWPSHAASWASLVVEAADETTAILEQAADRDWSRNAAGLDWTCRTTLDHLALGVVGYAGLLIARPTDRYITLFASLDPQAPITHCLEGVGIAARILSSAVREADEGVRAWHPWGHSDGPGFAAMAVVELLVHGMDISRALGLDWRPPQHLCAPAVQRLFPEARTAPGGVDASEVLLWCTGRADLPGLGRRDRWQWDGTVR